MRQMKDRTIAEIAACAGLLAFFAAAPLRADEATSVEVEVGSKRIGGPGASRVVDEQRAVDSADVFYTEENLPKKGDAKRIPALHAIAARYASGAQWKEACENYDILVEEGGDVAIAAAPDGKANAARSFLECGRVAAVSDFDRAEKLLQKSERFAPTSYKHAAIRRKIARETYRKLLASGDVDGAFSLHAKYQSQEKDEDERIWMGEQIVSLAVAADKEKDELRRDALLEKAKTIAPMNAELRRLEKKIHTQETILRNASILAAAAFLAILLGVQISKWRSRRRVENSRRRVERVIGGFDGLGDDV